MRLDNIRIKKIICVISIIILILLFSYKNPSLARFRKGLSSNVWNGMIASKYRSGDGTINNPYIISNGDELAFFSAQLENNNYEGKYFKITNDILLNEGLFNYENDVLTYKIDSYVYYISGDKYYDNALFSGDYVGTINTLSSLDNFKGTLDGDHHVIYGYFNDQPLFTNLNGNISSLYLENAVVEGDGNISLLADIAVSSKLKNIITDGYVIGNSFVPVLDYEDDITLLNDFDNFDENILSGMVVYAKDSELSNCINKAKVFGGYLSGTLLGSGDNVEIVNAYSIGNSIAFHANLIGVITGDSTISHVYNSGIVNGGLIGYAINATLDLNNSFIVTNNYLLVDSIDSTITSTNNYYVSEGKGSNIPSTLASFNNLMNKNYLSGYYEFVNINNLTSNPQSVWVFDNNNYPLLYIDDVIYDNTELHVNTYTWNSYSYILETHIFTNNLTMLISDVDDVHITDKYYYISNNRTPLTKDELLSVQWTEYTEPLVIDTEGVYVLYAKVVDNNDYVSYLNSDILVLDNSGSDISITMENNTWNDLNDTIFYIDHDVNISVTATDVLSGVKTIEYYLSNSRVNDLESINWQTYTNSLVIDDVGEYIIYVKAVDECDYVTYASTPLIIYDGYSVSGLKPIGFSSGNRITKKSSIMFDIDYTNNKQDNIVHNLVSSQNLPLNTKITMFDKTNNKVYEYIVNNPATTYALSLFKEKGKNTDVYYSDSIVTNESFTFIIDFSGCSINSDYSDLSIYLTGTNNGVITRPTIEKQPFSISSDNNVALSHTVSTNYDGTIIYNSDSITNIPITSSVTIGSVFDTTYANMKTGLAISLVDEDDHIIDKEYLKNIIFKIGEDLYAPDMDGITRINLNTNASSNITLSIITYDGSLKLEEGTYYIKIYGYASYDGIYFGNTVTTPILIPVSVISSEKNNNYQYSFDVSNSENIVVDKNSVVNYNFSILQDGLKNPNIKVSMYKKNQLTAYNQEYTLIDLQNYTTTVLDRFIDKIYYVSRNAYSYSRTNRYNTFSFDLNTTNLEKTCYKFVFDVYSGNQKIESISKYIIIR